MSDPDRVSATAVVQALAAGDPSAAGRLFPLVYAELKAVAARRLAAQRANHTLQATALVHEAYVRLIDQTGVQWKDRAHFFAVAAKAMRQILTDHARRKLADKRGGDWQRVTLENVGAGSAAEVDVLTIDELLGQLAEADERKHRIVELRFFAGLSVDEIAEIMGLSKTTVESEWRATRAWLAAELGRE